MKQNKSDYKIMKVITLNILKFPKSLKKKTVNLYSSGNLKQKS